MDIFLEILKITLPAAMMVWIVSLMLNRQNEAQALWLAKQDKSSKPALNIRLKAYERLTLFIERISPEKLIQRTVNGKMTCNELQIKLLQTIRQEYEHNLTQQLYISDDAWQSITYAKESIIQLINASMTQVKAEDNALVLSRLIIESYQKVETSPTEIALRQLKKETISLFF